MATRVLGYPGALCHLDWSNLLFIPSLFQKALFPPSLLAPIPQLFQLHPLLLTRLLEWETSALSLVSHCGYLQSHFRLSPTMLWTGLKSQSGRGNCPSLHHSSSSYFMVISSFFFRSHVMKTFKWLLLGLLLPLVHHAQDVLPFASQVKVGLEDALVYLLHRADSHLDKGRVLVLLHWQTKKHFSPPGH